MRILGLYSLFLIQDVIRQYIRILDTASNLPENAEMNFCHCYLCKTSNFLLSEQMLIAQYLVKGKPHADIQADALEM